MKHKILSLAAFALLTAVSCTQEEAFQENRITRVNLELPDFLEEDGTRSQINVSASDGISYSWAIGDVLGIFPDEGDQVSFRLTESSLSADGKNATFDGGAWALKDGHTYYSYFPFSYENFSESSSLSAIPVDYTGQSITEWGDTKNAGKYDFNAAGGTSSNSGALSFQFQRLGALLRVKLTLPATATYQKLTLSTDASVIPVKGKVNLSASTIAYIPQTYASEISVNLNDIWGTKDQIAYVYLMLPPMTLLTQDKFLTATLSYNDGRSKGAIYSLCKSGDTTPHTPDFKANTIYKRDAVFQGDECYVEFTAFNSDWELEYSIDSEITRASKQVGYTFNVGEKISVYGFESNDEVEFNQIFNNQEVENTAGNNSQVWTYSPKVNWTSGSRYVFYAAYPYEQPFAFDTSTMMFSIDDFVVSNKIDDQVDLMIAERNYASPNNVVELNFHHILSNVNFYAKVSSDVNPKEVTSVDIISLDVTGLLNKGTYTQTGWTSNHQAVGTWDTPLPPHANGEWSVDPTKSSSFYVFPGIAGGQATALPVGGGDGYKNIATDMLLMPQKLFYVDDPEKGISAEMDPVLDVEFKVSYNDATSQTFKRSLRLSSLLSYTKRTLNASTGEYTDETVNEPIYQWLPNYKYNYFLCFNPAKTTRIWSADSDDIQFQMDPETDVIEPEKGNLPIELTVIVEVINMDTIW